ncbi:hypothetical protein AB6A40_004227 [Gnathostoma spinigerum]|uniref:Protein-tyrosine-phosphatase n=1 Tax=Gnathostoma spinigerum TaxID=75299 RepID=A0ABD6EKM4_9BILA
MSPISFEVNPEYAEILEIVPGLFSSGVSALTAENMKKYRISFIVNTTCEVPNLRMLGNIPRTKLWLKDESDANVYPILAFQADQIEEVIRDGGCVLVHDVAGVSRSATICLAYLVKYQHYSLKDAYRHMQLKRPMVRPNIGFWQQLIAFEKEITGQAASVDLIQNPTENGKLEPDVYSRVSRDIPSLTFTEVCERHHTSSQPIPCKREPSFQPVLSPLLSFGSNLTDSIGSAA